jgi:hypothetical protein
LSELFHHERRFIGCLTLRRVKRVRRGEPLAGLGEHRRVDAEDELAFAALAARLLHPLPAHPRESGSGASMYALLAVQAWYEPDRGRCPALGPDGSCSVHHDRKPTACRVAPLEAWLPDRFQAGVLASRLSAAEYRGSDCVLPGERAGRVVTRGLKLVQPEARDVLARRRAELASDKRFWGDAVFAELARDLASDPAALARIPLQGFVSIPLAPILLVLARVSERCRARCLRFLEAQLGLIEAAQAERGGSGALPRLSLHQDSLPFAAANELAALARASRHLLGSLSRPLSTPPQPHAAEMEAWLGL